MEKELELVEEMLIISKELFDYNKDKEGSNELKEYTEKWENIKQALLKSEKNEKIIEDLKTLITYADYNNQEVISLAVLKNALKEVKD